MPRKRKHVNLTEKLASALSLLLTQEQRDEVRGVKTGKPLTAKQVIALFQFDHAVLHALDGSDRWHNLTPLLFAPHRIKSRRDTGVVAKVKRTAPAWQEHRARMQRPDKAPSRKPAEKRKRSSFARPLIKNKPYQCKACGQDAYGTRCRKCGEPK